MVYCSLVLVFWRLAQDVSHARRAGENVDALDVLELEALASFTSSPLLRAACLDAIRGVVLPTPCPVVALSSARRPACAS